MMSQWSSAAVLTAHMGGYTSSVLISKPSQKGIGIAVPLAEQATPMCIVSVNRRGTAEPLHAVELMTASCMQNTT